MIGSRPEAGRILKSLGSSVDLYRQDDSDPIDVLLMYAYTACGVIESRLICVIEGEQMENVAC